MINDHGEHTESGTQPCSIMFFKTLLPVHAGESRILFVIRGGKRGGTLNVHLVPYFSNCAPSRGPWVCSDCLQGLMDLPGFALVAMTSAKL